jgi:penicillin amidase
VIPSKHADGEVLKGGEGALMVKPKGKAISIRGLEGIVRLSRNEYGIPLVSADSFIDLFYGLGWVHAYDRPVELELTRLVAKGTAAGALEGSEELIASDIYMRKYNLAGDGIEQVAHLTDEAARITDSYCAGINNVLENGRRPFEFKLIGHKPEPWSAADCITMTKIIGLIDMTETQGWVEKLIVQMLQNGVPLEQLRELFPYMTDEPDPDFLEIIKQVKLNEPIVPATLKWKSLPRMKASNNWVVAGSRTVSGKPILCGDPHLDSSRLPAIWHEIRLRSGDMWFAGCTVPGIPLPALGRTDSVAWSPTYGYMDVIDFFVEDVKDGKYRRGSEWLDFEKREEVVKVKKGEPRTVVFHENEHGTLDGDPKEDGYYLSMAFTLGKGSGADTLNHGAALLTSKTVEEIMPHFAAVDFCSQNWVCADSAGNIGYHQSGRCPVRAEGVSGLLPVPGWDPAYDWKGICPVDDNPSLFNPPDGFIGTANQDMNYCAKTRVCNLPMGDWRARRIHQLLGEREDHSVESMQKMHYERYSKQAEDWMPIIKPLLPEGLAADALRDWDLRYESTSVEASIFENIYGELARLVFGEQSLGKEVMAHLMEETIVFCDFTGLFDRVLLREESMWFGGRTRDDLLALSIERGLKMEAKPWGEGRKLMMNNIMFAGRLPKWLGFDYGPIEIIGNRATIPQGQIFKTFGGRQATFSPTFKFVTDFSEQSIHSTMAGGPSDRRFSRWYTSGVPDWVAGKYRVMRPEED